MRAKRATVVIGLSAFLVAAGAGCGPTRDKGGQPPAMKVLKAPKPPPTVPPPRDVTVPNDLRGDARTALRAATELPDPVLRAHAIEGVKQALQADGWPTVPTFEPRRLILAGLGDRQPVARMAACFAAGELKLEPARDALVDLAGDDDDLVQIAARYALHRLGDTRLSPDLERTARSNKPAVRGTTALALGLLKEPSALNVLRPMQADRSATVRLQVAEAMWRLGEMDGLQTLVGATISAYPDDRMLAILALAQPRDTRVIEHVRGQLTHEYPEVALVAARAMGMLGSDAGYGVALRGARSVDPRQRVLAALAFGAIDRPDAADVLAGLLKDADADVRIAAATAILQLK